MAGFLGIDFDGIGSLFDSGVAALGGGNNILGALGMAGQALTKSKTTNAAQTAKEVRTDRMSVSGNSVKTTTEGFKQSVDPDAIQGEWFNRLNKFSSVSQDSGARVKTKGF